MSAIKMLNKDSEVARRGVALAMNVNAGKGMQEVLKSNLGPKGTLKMLVSGSGDVKITKDGKTLLHEMQIQNPTAAMIARAATAQDDVCGDGTTGCVVLIGEMLKQADRYLQEGVHPRVLSEGLDLGKTRAVNFLQSVVVKKDLTQRALLLQLAKGTLRTKVHAELADHLAELVVDAVETIRVPDQPIDLHMVEIMCMQHKSDMESMCVKGLVLDHGPRHPDMKKRSEKCFILTCNVSLEYEKSEVNSGFYYSTAQQRENLVEAERKFTDDRVRQIIELKRKVCKGDEGFIVINQKGIDPLSLDMMAKEGMVGLRRAKRRNMERLVLACGGTAVNSLDELTPDVLGYADLVYEESLGDDKFTFVEGVKVAKSVTLLIRGPNKHTIEQIKDAVNDGLKTVRNAVSDGALVHGAGCVETALHAHLLEYAKSVTGKAKLGILAFADAIAVIPKTLAENSGFDPQESFIKLQEAHARGFNDAGLNVDTGEACSADEMGVYVPGSCASCAAPLQKCNSLLRYDLYMVKRQMFVSAAVISSQLLLVDEIMKAGHGQK